jgi:hypothetical protein
MKKEKPTNKPSDKAKKDLANYRLNELRTKSPEILAQFAYQLECEWQKQEIIIKRLTTKVEKLEKEKESLLYEKNPLHKYAGFNKNAEGTEKIRFILERNKASMTFKEIMGTFLLLEPELKERWGNINKSISYLLAKACIYKAITKAKKYGERGYYIYSSNE